MKSNLLTREKEIGTENQFNNIFDHHILNSSTPDGKKKKDFFTIYQPGKTSYHYLNFQKIEVIGSLRKN